MCGNSACGTSPPPMSLPRLCYAKNGHQWRPCSGIFAPFRHSRPRIYKPCRSLGAQKGSGQSLAQSHVARCPDMSGSTWCICPLARSGLSPCLSPPPVFHVGLLSATAGDLTYMVWGNFTGGFREAASLTLTTHTSRSIFGRAGTL